METQNVYVVRVSYNNNVHVNRVSTWQTPQEIAAGQMDRGCQWVIVLDEKGEKTLYKT